MHKTIEVILKNMGGAGKHRLPIDFRNEEWHRKVKPEPGWYFISTTAPIDILKMSHREEQNVKHYKIGERVAELEGSGIDRILIKQSGNEPWVVYSGQARDLKSRAREHVSGNKGTACLGLMNHDELKKHEWYFEWYYFEDCVKGMGDHEILRKLVEQAWRAKHGWPVLCRE